MTSKRSTIGAYDLGMGDSSVRIEDAGDLRVRQAMIGRPKSVSRDASIGDGPVGGEGGERRRLVLAHQSAVTLDIRGEDGDELALERRRFHAGSLLPS